MKEAKKEEMTTLANTSPSGSKLTCSYCNQVKHIEPNCARWRATQIPKPVALVVRSTQGCGEGLECGSGNDRISDSIESSQECTPLGEAGVDYPLVKPPTDRLVDSGFDYCQPFTCLVTVTLRYLVPVFRDSVVQQSVFRNVTGNSLCECWRGEVVLGQGMNFVDYYDYVHVELTCHL